MLLVLIIPLLAKLSSAWEHYEKNYGSDAKERGVLLKNPDSDLGEYAYKGIVFDGPAKSMVHYMDDREPFYTDTEYERIRKELGKRSPRRAKALQSIKFPKTMKTQDDLVYWPPSKDGSDRIDLGSFDQAIADLKESELNEEVKKEAPARNELAKKPRKKHTKPFTNDDNDIHNETRSNEQQFNEGSPDLFRSASYTDDRGDSLQQPLAEEDVPEDSVRVGEDVEPSVEHEIIEAQFVPEENEDLSEVDEAEEPVPSLTGPKNETPIPGTVIIG